MLFRAETIARGREPSDSVTREYSCFLLPSQQQGLTFLTVRSIFEGTYQPPPLFIDCADLVTEILFSQKHPCPGSP